MDHKQIVNRIWDSQLTLPDGDVKPILIIDLKSSVNSLKYEIYSTLGEYLSGTYTRQIDFTQVSNNRNLLLFYLNQLNVERVFFIRLLEVDVINTQIPNQSSYNFRHNTPQETSSQVIKITDPIFYFHQLKPMVVPIPPTEQANIIFAVDDCNDRQSPPPSVPADQPPSVPADQPPSGTVTGETLTDDCCHICQQPFVEGDDIKLLSCDHKFHSREINDWLERKNTCPICSI